MYNLEPSIASSRFTTACRQRGRTCNYLSLQRLHMSLHLRLRSQLLCLFLLLCPSVNLWRLGLLLPERRALTAAPLCAPSSGHFLLQHRVWSLSLYHGRGGYAVHWTLADGRHVRYRLLCVALTRPWWKSTADLQSKPALRHQCGQLTLAAAASGGIVGYRWRIALSHLTGGMTVKRTALLPSPTTRCCGAQMMLQACKVTAAMLFSCAPRQCCAA